MLNHRRISLSVVFLFFLFLVSSQTINELYSISGKYYHAGDYQNALKYAEQALIKAKNELGENNLTYAILLGNLGDIYENLGNIQKAESNYIYSLKIIHT